MFYSQQDIYEEVSAQVKRATGRNGPIDYLMFVPDDEPTLDANLGRTIELLRPLNIPVAVISNASLLWRAGRGWSVVEKMIAEGELKEVDYLGMRYFVRRFSAHCEEQ